MTRRPSKNSRAAMRRKKRRMKQIRNTFFLILLMAIFFGIGCGAIYFLKGGSISTPPLEYNCSNEFETAVVKKEQQKASAFAQELCVVTSDVPLEGAGVGEGQEGILFDLDKEKVLYSKGAYHRVYPASITKIMTAMIALKHGNMDDVVTITQENVTLEEGSQVCGFIAGDQVTMEQLLYSLLVFSGNDAASAIATHIGGSIDGFVELMNSYARELGCTGTHFTNPHGLQDENHYTTPYDIYLMLNEAHKFPQFTDITQLSSYNLVYTNVYGQDVSVVLPATDHYLTGESATPKDVTILGGKTGTTSDAGNCLALLSQNAFGQTFVSIVMGADTKPILYEQMSSLLQKINNN